MVKSYFTVEVYCPFVFSVCLVSIDHGALATSHK